MVDLPQTQVLSRPRFVSRPLLILAAAMSVGILAGHYWKSPSKLIFLLSVAVSVGLGLVSFSLILKKKSRSNKKRHLSRETHLTLAWTFIIAAFFCLGFVLSLISSHTPASNRISRMLNEGIISSGDPVEVTGIVQGEP